MQFQKMRRLQKARRLMLGEDLDAASASYEALPTSTATLVTAIRNVERFREVAYVGADARRAAFQTDDPSYLRSIIGLNIR